MLPGNKLSPGGTHPLSSCWREQAVPRQHPHLLL